MKTAVKIQVLLLMPLLSLTLLSCHDTAQLEFDDVALEKSEIIGSNDPDLSGTLSVINPAGEVINCNWYYYAGIQYGKSPDEVYRISMPADAWNGDLIVYAHGYVSEFGFNLSGPIDDFGFPADVYQAEQLALSLGYAFASTSFSGLGLWIQQGIQESIGIRHWFNDNIEVPDFAYIVGGSQGGIITTLIAERHPETFDGALSLCGPCGNFQKQLNLYGDFRLLFEYFFLEEFQQQFGTTLGSFENPNPLMQNPDLWLPGGSFYNFINDLIQNYPDRIEKLIKVSKAVRDRENLQTTIMSLLWYHIFTIEDAIDKLGGLAYDNTQKRYYGTGSWIEDWKINKNITRISGDPDAMTLVAASYETTGNLSMPLVMMHTTGDPIQLFLIQQPAYRFKVWSTGKWPLFSAIPIDRYGHCNFEPTELVLGITALVLKVENRIL